MDNYKIYSFSNTRHTTSEGILKKGQVQISDTPLVFDSLKDSIPLFEGNRMYWCTQDSHIQCVQIPSRNTIWSKKHLPSSKGSEYNFKINLIAISQNHLIVACYPFLLGIEIETGETAWKMEYPYSVSHSESLIYNNKLLTYALSTDFEQFLCLADLSQQKVIKKKEVEKSMPDFMLSHEYLDDFVWGHNLETLAAILEKFDSNELEKIWRQDYTSESLVKSGNNNPEKACWQGKYMLYNNQVIIPTDGKKFLSLNYTDGKKLWEFHLNQNHSQTNGFDIKDKTLYLIDDAEYIKLDVETGEVIERRDNEKEWEKAGLLYSTSNLCINGEVAAMGSIYEQCYGLIDLKTGIPFWTHKTRFQFDKFTPVLLDNILFVYSTMDGRIEIFAIE
jgi:outer membrane protein assembly factor BamB